MGELVVSIITFILFLVVIVLMLGILIIMFLMPLVMMVGYLYDCLSAMLYLLTVIVKKRINCLYLFVAYINKTRKQLIYWLESKSRIVKKIKLFVNNKIENIRNSKDENAPLTRYNTPICIYCFSVMPMLLMQSSLTLRFSEWTSFIVGILIYFVIMHIGMYYRERIKGSYDTYISVMEHHISFLKISFIPIGFLVTAVGFVLGFSGIVEEFKVSFEINMLFTWVRDSIDFPTSQHWANIKDIFVFVKPTISMILLFYIISLPFQLFAYFMLEVILYFCNHNRPYVVFAKQVINIFKKLK